jgi:hypothetical protein
MQQNRPQEIKKYSYNVAVDRNDVEFENPQNYCLNLVRGSMLMD